MIEMFCLSARIKTCSSGRSRSLRFKLIRKMMIIIMIMKKMMKKMMMMMMIRMISHEQQQIENGNRWERLEWNDIA